MLVKRRQTWTWPCFHPTNSTVKSNLGLRSLPFGAVGYDEAQSRSLHLQAAAPVWTSLSAAARFLFQCWAAHLHLTCRPSWHPQMSAFVCCPGCRTPCSMGAVSHFDRLSGLNTTVDMSKNNKMVSARIFHFWRLFVAATWQEDYKQATVSWINWQPEFMNRFAKVFPLFPAMWVNDVVNDEFFFLFFFLNKATVNWTRCSEREIVKIIEKNIYILQFILCILYLTDNCEGKDCA